MVKKKKITLDPKWVILLVVVIGLAVSFYFNKNNFNPKPRQTESSLVTKEVAIIKVKDLPEVKDYLNRVPQGIVAVNGEEDTSYMIQVYEIKDGHTATLNWYTVNKTTGEVRKEF